MIDVLRRGNSCSDYSLSLSKKKSQSNKKRVKIKEMEKISENTNNKQKRVESIKKYQKRTRRRMKASENGNGTKKRNLKILKRIKKTHTEQNIENPEGKKVSLYIFRQSKMPHLLSSLSLSHVSQLNSAQNVITYIQKCFPISHSTTTTREQKNNT